MVYAIKMKKDIKTLILQALNRDGKIILPVFLASVELETGMCKEFTQKIIDNLVEVGQVTVKENTITRRI